VKRTATIIAFVIFSLAVLLPFSLNTQPVSAQTAYSIQSVDHQIEILYSGHVVIRDTIHVSGQITGDFQIGFPYKYGANVLKGMAYDANNNTYPISLGVQLEDRSGFYGAKISFPQGSPQVFTVVFVLSSSLLSQDATAGVFNLDFPAYPSFVQDVGSCNVAIVLPETPQSITITKNDGTVDTATYARANLPAFTYSPATASFSVGAGSFQMVNIKELNRQITISPVGDITASDSYRVTNNSTGTLNSFVIGLPLDASLTSVRDEVGRVLTATLQAGRGNTLLANITLISTLSIGGSTLLTAEYTLPSISSGQTTQFTLTFTLFPDYNYYVDEATVTFVPPEGARFLSPQLSTLDRSSSLTREIFQETLSISREGVSKAFPSEDALQITYEYNPLWLSFRQTMWMWTLAVVGTVVLAVWRRPKASAPVRVAVQKASVSLSPDNVLAFSEAYEEKSRVASELKLLEARAQKGKIPRRRYKVQRRTLEVRVDALSKSIADLKSVFRSAGGVYADIVRQLDIAEVELVEVETNLRTVEVRYGRGELPLEAYKKELADYQKRKEKAETTVNGILLRLREEIR
jgi:hypothetical protein